MLGREEGKEGGKEKEEKTKQVPTGPRRERISGWPTAPCTPPVRFCSGSHREAAGFARLLEIGRRLSRQYHVPSALTGLYGLAYRYTGSSNSE